MVVMYSILVISGLLGSAIAYDDLKLAIKSKQPDTSFILPPPILELFRETAMSPFFYPK